eukprot:2751906-Amphidinium_carterae.1
MKEIKYSSFNMDFDDEDDNDDEDTPGATSSLPQFLGLLISTYPLKVELVKDLFPVFVETPNKVITINTSLNEVVADFKLKVEDKVGIPPDQQRLTFTGKLMKDDMPLADYNVVTLSRLHVGVGGLSGGGGGGGGGKKRKAEDTEEKEDT